MSTAPGDAGAQAYDAFSAILVTFAGMLPLFMGRRFLADPESQATLLKVLCIAGLVYALPVLYEVRMSPQLNKMIYGFFPSDWNLVHRYGGYRPSVFLANGLYLGIFLSCSVISAIACYRLAPRDRRGAWTAIVVVMIGVLVLDKTLGAFLIAMTLGPLVLWASLRTQVVVAGAIAAVVLTYPVLRSADLVPTDRMIALAASIDPVRAGSLAFRFDNEDILLDKARKKPIFGWGGWGRARVINDRGEDVSVTDGYWIIRLGEGGLVRYAGEFGLLTLPLLLLALRRRRVEVEPATAALALVLAGNLIDVIPNAGLTSVTWLVTGALIGRVELGRITAAAPENVPASRRSAPQPVLRPANARYTRQTELRQRRSFPR